MMFVELFVTKGAFDADRLRRVAERLGSLREMGDGAEEMAAGSAAVFGEMFQVVVHEPDVWVAAERSLGPEDPPRCLVRVHVPAPWRKDTSATMISYTTRVVAEELDDSERPYREPVVQVQVIGVSEGSIGMLGRVTTSDGIVELLSEPYQEDYAAGRALKDPLCGVLVPLDDNAVTLEHEGTLHGFCCTECREMFVAKQQKEKERRTADART